MEVLYSRSLNLFSFKRCEDVFIIRTVRDYCVQIYFSLPSSVPLRLVRVSLPSLSDSDHSVSLAFNPEMGSNSRTDTLMFDLFNAQTRTSGTLSLAHGQRQTKE